jgi:hypothetical protein
VRYKRLQKILRFSALSCKTLLVSDSMSESSSLVPNQKSSDSSEKSHYHLWRYPLLSPDPSFTCYWMLPFLPL